MQYQYNAFVASQYRDILLEAYMWEINNIQFEKHYTYSTISVKWHSTNNGHVM